MNDKVRSHIAVLITQLGLTDEELREVKKYQWKNIQQKIEEKFLRKPSHKTQFYWYWEDFKSGYSISFDYDAYKYLYHFVPEQEKVWFLAAEEGQRPKFWIYEGKVWAIQKLLMEGGNWYEYYLVSKNYEWILCENHHGYLIGSGEKMVQKMIRFKQKK